MSELNTVTQLAEDGIRAVQNRERFLIRKMRHRLERAALDASRINDNGLDDGDSEVFLDEDRKREAMDMRKSMRHRPGYIDVRLRRVETTEKLDALRDNGQRPALNIGNIFVQVNGPPPSYPVKQLDTAKGDE